jgi:hypothetical protein
MSFKMVVSYHIITRGGRVFQNTQTPQPVLRRLFLCVKCGLQGYFFDCDLFSFLKSKLDAISFYNFQKIRIRRLVSSKSNTHPKVVITSVGQLLLICS